MRIKRNILLVLVLSFSLLPVLKAQEIRGYPWFDAATLRCYYSQQWDSLINYGNSALKEGHDYYFLNARMGVAWFEKGNYKKAATYFKRALKYNGQDPFASEYLFWSLKMTGQVNDANAALRHQSDSLLRKLGAESMFKLAYVYAEMGAILTDANKGLDSRDIDGELNVYGEYDLPDNGYYFQAGGGFSLGRLGQVYLGYQNLTQERYHRVRFDDIDTLRHSYNVEQNSFYASVPLVITPGFRVVPTGHLVLQKYSPIGVSYIPAADSFIFRRNKVERKEWALGLAVQADLGTFSSSAHLNWTELGLSHQLIVGAALTWNPQGNLNSWLRLHVANLSEDNENRVIYEPSFGLKATSWLWLEGSCSFGNLTHYSAEDLYVLYNKFEKAGNRYSLALHFPVMPAALLSLRATMMDYSSNLLEYKVNETSQAVIPTYNKTDFMQYSIIGAIRWNF